MASRPSDLRVERRGGELIAHGAGTAAGGQRVEVLAAAPIPVEATGVGLPAKGYGEAIVEVARKARVVRGPQQLVMANDLVTADGKFACVSGGCVGIGGDCETDWANGVTVVILRGAKVKRVCAGTLVVERGVRLRKTWTYRRACVETKAGWEWKDGDVNFSWHGSVVNMWLKRVGREAGRKFMIINATNMM